MNDERAREAVAMLRALADRDEVSACEAESRDMPESVRFHEGRQKMLIETASEIERLRAALKPFAAMADHCERHGITSRILTSVRAYENGSTVWVNLTLPDCKRAAEVLK